MDAVTSNLIKAAIKWWAVKRYDLTERQHVNDPTHGCPTTRGQEFAVAVAEYVRHHGSDVPDENVVAKKPARAKPSLSKKKVAKKVVKKSPPRRKTKK